MRFPSGVTDQYIYFVAVDSTDYVTRETGLSSFTVYRARNGAAAAAYTTPTIAEVSSANMPGVYSLLLDEDMTIASGNKSEEVVLHITQASMAPVTLVYELYRPDVTDGETITVSSGAVSTVTTTTTATSVTTVNGLAAGVITATSIAADAIGAAELAADAVTEIAAGVWDRLTSGLTTVGSAGKLLVDNLNATVSSRASQTSVDTVDDFLDTEIAAIKAKTDNLPADPADASDIASSFSTVNSTLSTIAGYIDTEVATIVSQTGASAIRAAVGLASANLDTQIGTLATAANLSTVAGYLDTEIAAILADTNELQADWADGGRLDLLIDAINAKTTNLPSDPADASVIAGRFDTLDTSVADLPTNAELATALGDIPSAAAIADAVWDEALAGHAGAGSTGEQLAAAGAAGDPWATALPGAYSAGSAGKIVGDALDAAVSTRASQATLDTLDGVADAIKVKTDSLTFTVAGQVDANIQYVNDVQVTGTGASGDEWGP